MQASFSVGMPSGAAGRHWGVLLVSFLAQFAAASSNFASNFTPGAVCQGVNSSVPASEMLRGQHLVINELVWSPYASIQQTAPKGWVGLNIDLYERISQVRLPPLLSGRSHALTRDRASMPAPRC